MNSELRLGDIVNYVAGQGVIVPATVIRLREGDVIDVNFKFKNERHISTQAALDESGQKVGHWFPVPKRTPSAAPALVAEAAKG